MSCRLDDGIIVLILNTKELISNYRIGQDDVGQKQSSIIQLLVRIYIFPYGRQYLTPWIVYSVTEWRQNEFI